MKVTKQYYINNMCWGWFIGLCFLYLSWNDEFRYKNIYLIINIYGTIFFPVSKWAVESFFLGFTTREFWNRGLFSDTAGKAGGLALYSFIVFLLSIPITIIFILFVLVKRLFF
ncbi:colicin E1 family microcin immunity protein [Proteus sp. FME41]|uniref:colicin E1 family microcin immunity protein n=1 Tax=Proteus sp. FME41 TaxID=2742608 RepID=UPI0018689C81|nr:colicin E1 family microcin immunity protein [Proteus sp. FME41]